MFDNNKQLIKLIVIPLSGGDCISIVTWRPTQHTRFKWPQSHNIILVVYQSFWLTQKYSNAYEPIASRNPPVEKHLMFFGLIWWCNLPWS
jgi:hypothetical protein